VKSAAIRARGDGLVLLLALTVQAGLLFYDLDRLPIWRS
jgi:hypothetical protein